MDGWVDVEIIMWTSSCIVWPEFKERKIIVFKEVFTTVFLTQSNSLPTEEEVTFSYTSKKKKNTTGKLIVCYC